MFDKIIELLLQFSNTFWMLLCVLIFAMTGSFEGMLISGVFAIVVFIMEVFSCIQRVKKNKRRKERTHGNQKVT